MYNYKTFMELFVRPGGRDRDHLDSSQINAFSRLWNKQFERFLLKIL